MLCLNASAAALPHLRQNHKKHMGFKTEESQKSTANWRCFEVADSSVLVLCALKSVCKGC